MITFLELGLVTLTPQNPQASLFGVRSYHIKIITQLP